MPWTGRWCSFMVITWLVSDENHSGWTADRCRACMRIRQEKGLDGIEWRSSQKNTRFRETGFFLSQLPRMSPRLALILKNHARGGIESSIQHRCQPGSARSRSGDFGSESVPQPHAVKAVTVMIDLFNGPEIHYGVPTDLDERVTAQPAQEITQRVISGKLFPHRMNPGASIVSQHRCNL